MMQKIIIKEKTTRKINTKINLLYSTSVDNVKMVSNIKHKFVDH